MPDLLSDDETRAAFASLRAAELPHVSAPGAGEVRRIVRRRKATRAVTIAGGLVVLAGAALATITALPKTSQTAGPPERTPIEWGQIAAAMMPSEGQTPDRVASASGPLDSPVMDVDQSASHGAYRLRVTCAGAGEIHVKLSAGGAADETDVTCGGDIAGAEAQTRTMNVTVPSGNAGVTVTIEPSAAALNKAGFAYVLTWTDGGGPSVTESGGPAIPRSR